MASSWGWTSVGATSDDRQQGPWEQSRRASGPSGGIVMKRFTAHTAAVILVAAMAVPLEVSAAVSVAAAPAVTEDQPAAQAKPLPERSDARNEITQADRQAVAESNAALGVDPQAAAAAGPVGPGDTPRYFSHPNYANSPLRMSDAAITFTGDGAGASATATVDPATGAVTDIELIDGGADYTVAPEVEITSSVPTATGASATATITGAVDTIAVDAGGSGYTDPTVIVGGVPTLVGNPLTERGLASDSADDVLVVLPDALSAGVLTSFESYYQAGASDGRTFTAYVLRPTGTADEYTVAFASETFTLPTAGTSGELTWDVPDVAVEAGDRLAFYGSGIALDIGSGTDGVYYPSPAGPAAASTITLGVAPFPTLEGARTYSFGATVIDPSASAGGSGATATAALTDGAITGITVDAGGSGYTAAPTITIADPTGSGATATATISGSVDAVTVDDGGTGYMTPGLRKFVDGLPGLGEGGANNLGQYIPVAEPDTTTYPGSDYYEIAVVQYREQMHSDLPATLLRGYVQLSTDVVPGKQVALSNALLDGTNDPITEADGTPILAVDDPHYMGPLLNATKDRPVRIKFRNLLPTGVDGELFLPVDTTVMGAGPGADMHGMDEPDPQRLMCQQSPKPAGCFTDNRTVVHLHGGITPWISDGTPHQWITPAGEDTSYPEGVSVQNVPDMPDPGDGSVTLFYTNQQSARLSFYHDHAWGITRLNVYAGMAAPYLIGDPTEQALIDAGLIPERPDPAGGPGQDVRPERRPAGAGGRDLGHRPVGRRGQPVGCPTSTRRPRTRATAPGVNQYGRWAYGPWFWPPTTGIDHGPVANPYFDPACDPDVTWCEPPMMPGTPYNSMGMESFDDTPVVNGTAYPTMTVDPKSYRMRLLNAANDRFFNFSLYEADSTGTEVALNADEVAAALEDPAGVFPTPDTSVSPKGPSWIQIGSEGGFLPAPTVIPPQPITWVTDPTVFNAGNVDQHSLLIAPAERADVVVDFSQYAGKTLILYNDAPAAFPARDPRYDYYTGSADLTDTGGVPTIVAGYGPNTRTVMQIKVADTAPDAPFDLAALKAAFAHQADGSGVFESGQNPIIVGQGAYNADLRHVVPEQRAEGRPGPDLRRVPQLRHAVGQHAHDAAGAQADPGRDGRGVRAGLRADERVPRRRESQPCRREPEHGADGLRGTAHRGARRDRVRRYDTTRCRRSGGHRCDAHRDGGRRDPDLEVHPQRRGHAPDPLPPVRRAAAQPRRLGRRHPQARSQRAGLEGHGPGEPAGGHDRGRAAVDPARLVRPAQQHPACSTPRCRRVPS